MKKIMSMLLSFLLVVSVSVPAFAAQTGQTVTISLDNINDIMPPQPGASHEQQLMNLQKQYLTYCNDVFDRGSASGQYDSKTQAQDAARKKLELGYISQKEYNDAVQAVSDLSSSQQAPSNQRAQDLLKLRNLLGLDDVDQLIVKPADYSKVDFTTKLSSVKYAKDLEDLKLEPSQVETFKSLYDALTQANSAYQLDSGKYQTKQAQVQLMQQKFAKGYASKKQVNDITLELQTLESTVAKEKNSVYIAYLRYDFMRDNGYSPDSVS